MSELDREMIYIQHSEYLRLVRGQSKRGSLVEALVNVLVGFGVATVANLLVLPLFGYSVSLVNATGIGLIFTLVSLVRSYLLRRTFNWLQLQR